MDCINHIENTHNKSNIKSKYIEIKMRNRACAPSPCGVGRNNP